MNCRHLTYQLVSSTVMLAIANMCIMQLSKESNPRKLIRDANASEPATVIFLGDSTMAAGIDTSLFHELAGGTPLNLSLGATSPVEHLQLYLHNPKHHQASVYYGFFDTTLSDPPIGNIDLLTGNRAMSLYVNPELAIRYYCSNNQIETAKLNIARRFPLLVERGTIWAKVEVIRRRIGSLGMPVNETNQFGRSSDFTLLEQDDKAFNTSVSQAFTTKTVISPPIVELLESVTAAGKTISFIEMPMPSAHRQKYYSTADWRHYRRHITANLLSRGGSYLDVSEWVPDSGFSDAMHMNTAGANIFSRRLALYHLERNK